MKFKNWLSMWLNTFLKKQGQTTVLFKLYQDFIQFTHFTTTWSL